MKERMQGVQGPERRDDDARAMTLEETASFSSAYERARKTPAPERGQEPTRDVFTAQAVRRAFVNSAARELRIDV